MRTSTGIVMAIGLLTAGVAAQQKVAPQKPSFSGRWVITSPAEAAGREQIITVTDQSLTVEQPSAKGQSRKFSYQLDGVERRMAIPGRAASEIVSMAKAAWDGNRIVVTTSTSYPNGMKEQSIDTWSIDAQGRLVIDTVEKGPAGPGPTVKLIHVRKQ